MDTTTQVLSILVLLLTLVVTTVVPQFVRRRRDISVLRRQPAYEMLDDMTAVAVESGRTVLVGMGSAGLGGEATVLALAAEEIAYQTVARAAYGDSAPIVAVSEATGLPLALDAARKAYRRQDKQTPAGTVRWVPTGPRSFAYAAAMTAYMSGDSVLGQVLVGRYGAEMALIAEFGVRRGGSVIAASDQLDGQAVAFAFSRHPLIGEEIFQAPAYLSDSRLRRGEAIALDVLRWFLIAAVVAIAAYRITNVGG